MYSIFLVGLGGFMGSVLRYGLGKIPVAGDFPVMTLVINVLGSFVIGFLFLLEGVRALTGPNAVLFLQTGFCGGFTTFSTFSLQTVNLLQSNKYFTALSYTAFSVLLCLLGTFLGMLLACALKNKFAL